MVRADSGWVAVERDSRRSSRRGSLEKTYSRRAAGTVGGRGGGGAESAVPRGGGVHRQRH